MPTIDRTNYNALVDDDGSNTTGTPWVKNQVKIVLLDPIDTLVAQYVAARSAVSTTGHITALALPSGAGPLGIYMTNATLSTVQGMAAGLDGQQLTIVSTGAGQV